jgi:hypothetical protein
MTKADRLQLLRAKVAESSQSKVAKALGYKPATISLVLSGNYPGSPDTVLERVAEVYGSETVPCPLHGELSLGTCAEHRRRLRPGGNHERVQQYRACKACERGKL